MTAEVCLVSMPYASLTRPSLALSLLRTLLGEAGIGSTVLYPNLWWCERLGIERYHLCSHKLPNEYLGGEWTFARAAFREQAPEEGPFIEFIRRHATRVVGYRDDEGEARLIENLLHVRSEASDFVEETARRVIATGARIVGCTSTFEQHAASLALLRRIREIDPGIVTMMGGANCETVMGRTTHEAFPWVDFVVSGEADGMIVDLCRRILDEGPQIDHLPAGVLGPIHRRHKAPESPPRRLFRDLDTLPDVDFDDYFEALATSSAAPAIRPSLPVEFSRGCWWGAVHHCTFCGLNGSSMTFRSKSPERVIRELESLERRYRLHTFEAVDNILDMAYFKTVLPRLAESPEKRSIFYEVKANLGRAQVETMRKAGIVWIQPGIESLHSKVLTLMDKGVQGWQNIQLLKYAREFGIRVSWAVLWGFPGEEDAWYEEMAAVMPLLEHLQAPSGMIRLRFDRFSVYHKNAEKMGLRLEPVPAMRHVYPLSPEKLADLAYFFVAADNRDVMDVLRERPGAARAWGNVKRWRKAFFEELRPVLSMEDRGDVLRILDTRACAKELMHELTGPSREAYLECERAASRDRLVKQFGASTIDDLVARRIVVPIDGRVLGLAVAGDLPELPTLRDFPGGFVEDVPLVAPERAALSIGGK
jgi:ribosomal peptide maturation radical SAM protein 1